MEKFLRCLVWYLTSVLAGLFFLLFLLPVIGQGILYNHVPINDPAFIEGYWFNALIVLSGGMVAAGTGFFMWGNRALRQATLTLPLWAPFVYVLLYIALSYN